MEFPSIKNYTSNQYAGKAYDDVSSDLNWKPIRTILVKPQKPDVNVKYEIFRRLNAGVPLKGHEIRRCIFPSPFYAMLKEINENEKWRKMFSANGRPDPHMKDEELLLRGFAMLEDNDKYAGTVSKFLNDYSKKAQSYNDKKIKQLKQLFISFLENNLELSDLMRKTTTSDKPSSSISPLIFESVFVVACEGISYLKNTNAWTIGSESLKSLKTDLKFSNSMKEDTASTKNVTTRLDRARSILVDSNNDGH